MYECPKTDYENSVGNWATTDHWLGLIGFVKSHWSVVRQVPSTNQNQLNEKYIL